MEAPEKIYLATTKGVQNLDTSFVGIAHSDPQDIVEPIEYIRKDALIKRIHELLSCRIDYITYYHDKTEFVNEIIEDLNEDIE